MRLILAALSEVMVLAGNQVSGQNAGLLPNIEQT
jgi:hypothetical protein